MSSGMLSEAVLLHLDEAGEKGSNTVYIRYVDDVKILAKSEDVLRRKLIKLDITAKEVGLFPQTSKINMRKIGDPDEEIKSVSRPPEISIKPFVNQDAITKRLLSMIRVGKVTSANTTRFKYLVAHSNPTARLNGKLLAVLRSQPEFSSSISNYFSRYKRIPESAAQTILTMLNEPELYHAVYANILDACVENMHPAWVARFGQYAVDRLFKPQRNSLPLQPTFKAALIRWGLSSRTLTFDQSEKLFQGEVDWWVKMRAMRALSRDIYGPPSYAHLINQLLRTSEGEAANVAFARLLSDKVRLSRPYGNVAESAKRALRAAGIISSTGQPISRINGIMAYIFKHPLSNYRWDVFFHKNHRHAELMMIFIKRNRETNIDAFLVQLDSFFDFLTREIWVRLKPTKNYPNFGSAIKDPTLTHSVPKLMAALILLHDLRLQSTTAHPHSQKTGAPTRRLKHRDFYKIRQALADAIVELEIVITP